MKNTSATANAQQAFQNFALQYSFDGDVKSATEFGTDYLDTVQDVNDYKKMIALFLAGKITATVEKINDDCTWRKERVSYKN